MKRNREINPEAFEKMLLWLNEDRDIAGRQYEAIRLRLIKIFSYRQCSHAEELTDKTIDRVVQKIDEIAPIYEGDPVLYFLSVANNIYRENLRKPITVELSDDIARVEDKEDFRPHYECLKKCLTTLSVEQRRLIINYYEEEKKAKIIAHKQLAKIFGIDINRLHLQAFRIRGKLQKCVLQCVEKTVN